MLSPTIQSALNDQINREQFSAQLYLALGAHLSARNYQGFAHWLRLQAEEEAGHALRLADYVLDRCGALEIRAVNAPSSQMDGVIQVFEAVLGHERESTCHIHALLGLARDEKDYPTEIALQGYVTTQVREEAALAAIVDHLRAVGDQGGAIWYLDHRMSKRQRGETAAPLD